VAKGLCNSVPSSSHKMYALPQFLDMTTSGPVQCGPILWLSLLYSCVAHEDKDSSFEAEVTDDHGVVLLEQAAVWLCSLNMWSWSCARSSACFWRVMAHCMMRSVVVSNESGGGRR
jgi:hypothetical protein